MNSAADLRVSISTIDDIEAVGIEWRLLEQSTNPSIFLSWLWIGTWLRTITCPAYLARVSRQGQVIGLGILCPHRQWRYHVLPVSQLHLNGTGDPDEDVITLEYNGLLCRPQDSVCALTALLDSIIKARRSFNVIGVADEIVIANVDLHIRNELEIRGYLVREYANAPSFCVDLAALRAAKTDVLSGLSKNTRYQIRRSVRLYEEAGPITVERAEQVDQAKAFLEELRILHQATWEGRGYEGAFFYSFFQLFHSRILEAGLVSGHVDLLKVTAGEEVIGYLYNLIYEGTVFYYTSGFAYSNDHKYKPGLVSHVKCIEYYQARGLNVYDFMAGAGQYKSSLGQAGPVLSSLAVQRPQIKLWTESRLRDLKHKWQSYRAERESKGLDHKETSKPQ